ESIQKKAIVYDRQGDAHYDVISAFIKSIRGSDPDAALFWLARMLEAGEDPRSVARRMVVHASEDIGLADPRALLAAGAAVRAIAWSRRIGGARAEGGATTSRRIKERKGRARSSFGERGLEPSGYDSPTPSLKRRSQVIASLGGWAAIIVVGLAAVPLLLLG